MSDMKDVVRVSAIYRGIDGEAKFAGMPTTFVKFFGCNLQCRGFENPGNAEIDYALPHYLGCDSAQYWHKDCRDSVKDMHYEDLVDAVQRLPANNLTLSGGEPLLHSHVIRKLLDDKRVIEKFDRAVIETNGTIPYTPKNNLMPVFVCVSPKLSNSGEPLEKTFRPEVLTTYNTKFYLKFVTNGLPENFAEILVMLEKYSEYLGFTVKKFLRYVDVYVMPEGRTIVGDPKYLDISTFCIKYGFIYCARVQHIIYGDRDASDFSL